MSIYEEKMIKEARTILHVDDNPGDVILIRKSFADYKETIKVESVPNGLEAMKYLKKETPYENAVIPDLIILDIHMPVMNGHSFLKKIKKESDLRRIPVVLMSSSDEEKDILESYDLYANSYIRKPVTIKGYFKVAESIKSFWFDVAEYPA
jgi:two-component system, chemotaxis family, response regulator Rcp1